MSLCPIVPLVSEHLDTSLTIFSTHFGKTYFLYQVVFCQAINSLANSLMIR